MLASKTKRNGWVLNNSEDERAGTGFDPREVVAAWNKGLGPSKDSIPSRTTSLFEGTPTPPAPRFEPSAMESNSEPIRDLSRHAHNGGLHAEKPQLYMPLARLLGPSAYSDHQRILASRSPRTSPTKRSAARTSPTHHAQHSSSTQSDSSAATQASVLSKAESSASSNNTSVEQSRSSADETHNYAESRKQTSTETHDIRTHHLQVNSDKVNAVSDMPRRSHRSLLEGVVPMSPVKEAPGSLRTDEKDQISQRRTSTEEQPRHRIKKLGELRIELPPPRDFKSAYPAILVDSSHLNDEYRLSNGTGGRRDSEDDSSWPSTPSTTPLDVYVSAAAVERSMVEAAGRRMSDGAAIRAAYLAASPCPSNRQSEEDLRMGDQRRDLGMGKPKLVTSSRPSSPAVCPSTPRQTSSRSPSAERHNPMRLSLDSPTGSRPVIAPQPGPLIPEAMKSRSSLSFEIPDPIPKRATHEAQTNAPKHFISKAASRVAHLARKGESEDSPERKRHSVDTQRAPSLDHTFPSPREERRSFELKPILLNSSANQSRVSFAPSPPSGNPTPNGSRSGKFGGLPYSKRWSAQASASSDVAQHVPSRASMDNARTPSATGWDTPLPRSPRLPEVQNDQQARPRYIKPANPYAGVSSDDRYTALPEKRKSAFAASMPSLHHGLADDVNREREQDRHLLLQEHIERQKGKVIRDSESIAEWIQISDQELPQVPSGAKHQYGNGGCGAFSNEPRARNGLAKPWKLGRFSASSIALPNGGKTAGPTGQAAAKRQISILRRPKSASSSSATPNLPSEQRTRNPSRYSFRTASGGSSAGSVGFAPNMGWTKANRHAGLQQLCTLHSTAALAATMLNVASLGRESVPFPLPKLDSGKPVEVGAEGKNARKEEKRQSRFFRRNAANPPRQSQDQHTHAPQGRNKSSNDVAVTRRDHDSVAHLRNESQVQVLLNSTTEQFSPRFELKDQLQTVKSIHPDVGNWQDEEEQSSNGGDAAETGSVADSNADAIDLELEDSDGESLSTLSEDPVGALEGSFQTNQILEPSVLGVFFSSIRGGPKARKAGEVAQEVGNLNAAVSKPLERMSRKGTHREGSITQRGKEIRLYLEDQVSAAQPDARNCALIEWKAVKMTHLADSSLKDFAQPPVSGELARKTRAMKLEAEVARGEFANFVGLASPKRATKQAEMEGKQGAWDGARREQPGSTSATPASHREELFISKAGLETFVVRRLVSGKNNKDAILEIHERHQGRGGVGGVRLRDPLVRFSLDDQRPGNLAGIGNFSPRDRGQVRQSLDLPSRSLASTKVQIQVRRKGLLGLKATFMARDGRTWFWRASSPLLNAPQTSVTGATTGINGGTGLSGIAMHLYALDGKDPVELAEYSCNALPRSSLALFKTKIKPTQRPNTSEGNPPAGGARPTRLGPGVGLRGAKPIRSNSNIGESAFKQRLMQNRRAAMSTESLIRPEAVGEGRGGRMSLQVDERPRFSLDQAPIRSHTPDVFMEGEANSHMGPPKRMGGIKFRPDCYDHELAVISLLALLGLVEI